MASMPASPTAERQPATRSFSSSSSSDRCSRSGYATFSKTDSESKSAAPWKTHPKRRRRSTQALSLSPVVSMPSTMTRPASGRSNPIMCFSSTDFPVPDPRAIVKISPSCDREIDAPQHPVRPERPLDAFDLEVRPRRVESRRGRRRCCAHLASFPIARSRGSHSGKSPHTWAESQKIRMTLVRKKSEMSTEIEETTTARVVETPTPTVPPRVRSPM